jgi:hypothetical protein
MYDLVIIGSGPAGLALAQCCSTNYKVLIIEKEATIGGCHRVKRVNYEEEQYFTEHGPRVYLSSYVNFNFLLQKMGSSINDLFISVESTDIIKKFIISLNIYEWSIIILHFSYLIFNNQHGRNINMNTFLLQNNFSLYATEFLDMLCRLMDGADIHTFSLNEFLQILNQQTLTTMYQPKKPNDKGLFLLWKSFLEKPTLEKYKVDFIFNKEIEQFNIENTTDNRSEIVSCIINGKIIKAKKFVFAIPPFSLIHILEKFTNIQNSFGPFHLFKEWTYKTKYLDYISITFHWDKIITFNNIYGFPSSDWGIFMDVLTDSMTFSQTKSKTVITLAITILDKISKNNGKTANQCTTSLEINKEALLQIMELFPLLEKPSLIIMSPNNYYHNNKWNSIDTAFIHSANSKFIPFESNKFTNLYNLGTHNGQHTIAITSLESAVSNSIVLANKLYPDLNIPFHSSISIIDILFYIIIIIIIIIIYHSLNMNILN